MTQPSKKTVARLRAETDRSEKWELIEGFTGLSQPSAIRLTPTLAKRLNALAIFHGTKSAEELGKRWLAERSDYESDLIEKARQQAG
jgi:hypothetical protein